MYDREAVVFGMLRLIVPDRANAPSLPTVSPRRVLEEQRRLGEGSHLRLVANDRDVTNDEAP